MFVRVLLICVFEYKLQKCYWIGCRIYLTFTLSIWIQIKDNRRADKISAGPQSHILEGVTWDEASRIKDANVSGTSDHVVLMGAASKGIIQRGYQHNATVYKAPYAKNPFDSVTDDELNDYKKTIERKRHGDCKCGWASVTEVFIIKNFVPSNCRHRHRFFRIRRFEFAANFSTS